jgi:hypothetical protein
MMIYWVTESCVPSGRYYDEARHHRREEKPQQIVIDSLFLANLRQRRADLTRLKRGKGAYAICQDERR